MVFEENWEAKGRQRRVSGGGDCPICPPPLDPCVSTFARYQVEELVAVVAEPGGHNIAHFVPETGWAIYLAKQLVHIATTNSANIRLRRRRRQHGPGRRPQMEDVRSFVLPKANFAATDYTQLLNWTSEMILEPPLTMSLSDAELQNVNSKNLPRYQ